jgi:hypothetical protein
MRIRNSEITVAESHHLYMEMKGETRAWSQQEHKEVEEEEIRTNKNHAEVCPHPAIG